MRILMLLTLLASALVVTACDDSGNKTTIDNAISIKKDGHIGVQSPGHPEADISAAGDLNIAGNAVAVNPAQRQLLVSYYAGAAAIGEHGMATGAAGAKVAGTALSSVARGLASGDTSKIDAEVNASAAKVKEQAANICNDLQKIYTTQQALAAQLDAFKPYAVIKADEADDCLRDLKDDQHN